VLYSQGGIIPAFIGTSAIGLIMGWFWALVAGQTRPITEMSIFRGLLVALGVFLAIDSIRNSVFVTYGVGWGVLMVLLLHLFSGRLRQLRVRTRDLW